MLRYLIKTLLQMNLFTDSMGRDASNGTDLLFNFTSLPSFNASFLDLGNFTFNEISSKGPKIDTKSI
ncbi:hypothetical protein SKAU_G00261770 [Synaphobranchus kaupii]|uniref:Uncharacterized protein n=1 Tax=Synaphobranchus kaupii TaxID=118154 RepID=A0A9Q1EYK5_SYNKA|nr:hypothetical protein SKAU_G00261770 [Synaphobranchus kaupii]